jgi:hypothetical protein
MAPQDGIIGPQVDRVLDVLSMGSLVAVVLGVLPTLSLVLTVIWTAIKIYETSTVQRTLKRRRRMKRIKLNERKRTGSATG